MAMGVAAYEQGDRRGGARLLGVASSAAPRDAALQSYAAAQAAKAGDFSVALRLWERALELAPERADFALHAAIAQRACGDAAGALARCEQVIGQSSAGDPGYPLMELLAQLRMPGPSYLEILARIHAEIRPRSYLEIGVASGRSIALALPGTRCIGVDPAPALEIELPGNIQIFGETSDAFFATRDVRALLDGLPIDLGFIDGMHLFEYALRDFIHMERHSAPGSTILFDDCWPLERRTAERERLTQFWNGDVWRILPALRKYRPELRIRTIATYPAGLCVVRGVNPASQVLSERYEDIVHEFRALDFSAFERDRETYLEPVLNDPERVRELLA